MRLFLTGAMSVLLVVFCAAGGWAQGNQCEENIDAGNGGCGINPQAVQNQLASGGIDFSGSDYDNRCATGTGGCNVMQPIMRFWEFDNFDGANSAVNAQNVDPTYWMVNPALDFAMGSETNRWIFFQANWANAQVQGCPTSGRTVAEVSWCDNGTSQAWYVVGSVPGPAYDFDSISGASQGPGGDDNMMPITQVPVPVGSNGSEAGANCALTATITGAPGWWTDAGANADPTLIAGYEIVYQNATPPGPAAMCNTGLGSWMPVLASGGGSNLGVVNDGAHSIEVPMPGAGQMVYLSARVVYADSSTNCAPGNCPDPQGQGAPASCFYAVSAGVDCGGGGPVTFDLAEVQRLTGSSAKVSWRTSEEYDTYGFKVMRAKAGSGDFQQVGGIVFAQGPGRIYTQVDANALRSESYDYQIVEIAFAGEPTVSELLHLEGILSGEGKRVRVFEQER